MAQSSNEKVKIMAQFNIMTVDNEVTSKPSGGHDSDVEGRVRDR